VSDETPQPETPEPDDFDELVKNQPQSAKVQAENIWDAIEQLWPQLHEGVLVKGIFIAEYVDTRGKVLRWQTSPDMAPWEMLGMLHQAVLDVSSDSVGDSIANHLIGNGEEDEDEVEDEQ